MKTRQQGNPEANTEIGFSVIDLVVAFAILTILGYFAVLEFRTTELSFERMNARSFVVQDLKRAQAETITQGCRGIMTVATDGRSYNFGCDYLSYDTNVPPQADALSFTRDLPDTITLSTSGQIIFNSRGQTVDAYDAMTTISLTLADKSGGGSTTFASGTLLGTGVFSFD